MWISRKKFDDLQRRLNNEGDHFSELISLILDHLGLDVKYLRPPFRRQTMELVPKKEKEND